MFKLLAPVQWEEVASRGTAKRGRVPGFFFLSAAMGDVAPDLWSGRELGGSRPAKRGQLLVEEKERENMESEKGLRQKEKGGGLRIPTQR